jgi:hypothetical protein
MCHLQAYGTMEETDLCKKYIYTDGLAGYLATLLVERLQNANAEWKLFMNGEVKDFVGSFGLFEGAILIFETEGITKCAKSNTVELASVDLPKTNLKFDSYRSSFLQKRMKNVQ